MGSMGTAEPQPQQQPQPLHISLSVYDVAPEGDSRVPRLNSVLGPRGLGLGGVFHGAIVVGDVEFSFGWCASGTGVYAVEARRNPMYTYRESVDLGPTPASLEEVRAIVAALKDEWPGASYDLLTRNCCTFCEDMAGRLRVAPVPGWLNRLAVGAAATVSLTNETVRTAQNIGAEVGRLWQATVTAAGQQQAALAERLQQQQQQGGGGGVAVLAGKQLLSGLSQLRAATGKLAEAAASRMQQQQGPEAPTAAGAPPTGLCSSSGTSTGSGAVCGIQPQQRLQGGGAVPDSLGLLGGGADGQQRA